MDNVRHVNTYPVHLTILCWFHIIYPLIFTELYTVTNNISSTLPVLVYPCDMYCFSAVTCIIILDSPLICRTTKLSTGLQMKGIDSLTYLKIQ